MIETEQESPTRVDKWLWAARFYKTRALASAAVQNGKVQINGERAKPSRHLRCGDELRIQKGSNVFLVEVRALSLHRGPAERAQTLYAERDSSVAARRARRDEQRLAGVAAPLPGGRPDKRARRQWRRLQGR